MLHQQSPELPQLTRGTEWKAREPEVGFWKIGPIGQEQQTRSCPAIPLSQQIVSEFSA